MRAKEIDSCRAIYSKSQAKMASFNPDTPLQKDGEYLRCLPRVRDEAFIPGSHALELLLRYSAAQLALELGDTGVTLNNGIEMHALRKRTGKTYYRFMGHDLPSPPRNGQPDFRVDQNEITQSRLPQWVSTAALPTPADCQLGIKAVQGPTSRGHKSVEIEKRN